MTLYNRESTNSFVTSALNSVVIDEIRAELGRKRVKQQELAEAIGISQATLSRRLNGTDKHPFTVAELEAAAGFFGIPLGALLGGAA